MQKLPILVFVLLLVWFDCAKLAVFPLPIAPKQTMSPAKTCCTNKWLADGTGHHGSILTQFLFAISISRMAKWTSQGFLMLAFKALGEWRGWLLGAGHIVIFMYFPFLLSRADAKLPTLGLACCRQVSLKTNSFLPMRWLHQNRPCALKEPVTQLRTRRHMQLAKVNCTNYWRHSILLHSCLQGEWCGGGWQEQTSLPMFHVCVFLGQ